MYSQCSHKTEQTLALTVIQGQMEWMWVNFETKQVCLISLITNFAPLHFQVTPSKLGYFCVYQVDPQFKKQIQYECVLIILNIHHFS